MSRMTVKEKIGLMSIARGLLVDPMGSASAQTVKPDDVKEMYHMLRDLVLEENDKDMPDMSDMMSYAVTGNGDGQVELMVFENGSSATVELDQQSLKQLIKTLVSQVTLSETIKDISHLKKLLKSLINNDAELKDLRDLILSYAD
jgi:hypothetical protein